MNDIKWTGRYILCGLALVLWVIIFANTSEVPEFLTGLVATAWGVLFVSREKEKINARKTL